LRGRGGGMFALGRLLWKQGVIWLFLAAGTGFIAVLFIYLNLTPLLNFMFVVPVLITMSITSTRIYTSLTDFCSSAGIVVDSDLEKSRRNVSNRVFLNVTVKRVPVPHVTCDQYPTGTPQSAVLSLNTSGQLCNSSQGPSLDDLESGVGR